MTNILYGEMSGHDSQIENISTDPLAKTVVVSLLAYPTPSSRDRIPITITFSNVTSVSTIMDMNELATNDSAGNVTQWHIVERAGTSFIQLTGGCLAITSEVAPTVINATS